MIKDFYKLGIKFLQEILRNNGYVTFGIDWLGRWHKKGFEYYLGLTQKSNQTVLAKIIAKIKILYCYLTKQKTIKPIYTATELTDIALKLINNNNNNKPFFLFIHYWDTHTPYNAPKRYTNNLLQNIIIYIEKIANS